MVRLTIREESLEWIDSYFKLALKVGYIFR